MRLTEYIHYLNRTDIGMTSDPEPEDYSHFTPWNKDKRARYLYQCKLRGKEPVK